MAEPSEYVTHPVLGALGWLPEFSHWFAQRPLPSGGQLDVVVVPDDDRYGFLPRAAGLFRWALANERRVLAEAMQAGLLELYNDTWREADEPRLSAKELAARLDWQLLKLKDCDVVPVEFHYDAGDLFVGHGVAVGLGAELQFRGIDLRG
jgi:hypothetical protein